MAIKKLKANGHIVQADWGQTDPKKMDYIHNKPEIPEIPKTWDWNKISNKPEIPENIATEDFVNAAIADYVEADVEYLNNTLTSYEEYLKTGAIAEAVSGKVDKITTAHRVYGTDGNGNFKAWPLSYNGYTSHIPVFNENAQLLVGANPVHSSAATPKSYVDGNFIAKKADSQTIEGNLIITNDLTIKGTTKTQDAQTQLIEENIIELNSGKVLNETQLSGVVINKDNTSAYGIVYDPSSDAVKLGLGTTNNGEFSFNSNEGTPIATREEYTEDKEWADDAIFVFDKATMKFKYSGKTLASFEEEIMTKMRAEMDTFVKDYVETYMSDIEIEHDDGTTEKVSKMIFGDDYEEKQNGTELWIKEN